MIRFPPRKILVGYDRSALSMTAWRHAAALAARYGASLELIYVEPWRTEGSVPGGGQFVLPGLTPALAREIRAEIRAEVGEGPKITVTEGDPSACILKAALKNHADLIVVGTHGRRGLSRVLLGSVAEEVIRSSPLPVFVARGPVEEIRSVLAPVHFTSYSDHGFAYAAAVATGLGAGLTALHVNGDPVWGGNPLMRLRRLVESLPAGLRARCEPRVVLDEDVCRGIMRAATKHDLVVLVAHKKSLLNDVFLGTTAEKLLRRSKKPLLVVPPPKRPASSLGRLDRLARTA